MENTKKYIEEKRIEVKNATKKFSTNAAISSIDGIAMGFVSGTLVSLATDIVMDKDKSMPEKVSVIAASALATGLAASSLFKAVKSVSNAIRANKVAKGLITIMDMMESSKVLTTEEKSLDDETETLPEQIAEVDNDESMFMNDAPEINTDSTIDEDFDEYNGGDDYDDYTNVNRKVTRNRRFNVLKAKFTKKGKNKESM